MQEKPAILLTRYHPTLNYGQTGMFCGYNEFSDEVMFRPDGENIIYRISYNNIMLFEHAANFEVRNNILKRSDSGLNGPF